MIYEFVCRHFPTIYIYIYIYIYVLEIPGASRLLCKSEWSIHVVNVRHIRNGVQFETQTPTRWKMNSYSVNAPSPVLSPSSILAPHSSHWAFIAAKNKFGSPIRKYFFFFFLLYFALKFFFYSEIALFKIS